MIEEFSKPLRRCQISNLNFLGKTFLLKNVIHYDKVLVTRQGKTSVEHEYDPLLSPLTTVIWFTSCVARSSNGLLRLTYSRHGSKAIFAAAA